MYTSLQVKPSAGQNIQGKVNEEEEINEMDVDENMKCLLKEKFKKLIEMNGQLIAKVNINYHKLSEEEIRFYNKLMHSNLKVLNNMAQNMIVNQTLIEE